MYQVRIMLPDSVCNLHCKYCINNDCLQSAPCEIDFDKLFKKLNLVEFRNISIWGGEPLFHPQLETVLRELRKHYPDKEIFILSNGTLLDEHFVQMFNELDISYGISHDARCQSLRCKDFLQEPAYIKLLQKLKHFTGFNCVISRDNCDLVDAYSYFRIACEEVKGDWQVTFGLFELTDEKLLDYMPSVEQYQTLYHGYKDLMRMACEGAPHLETYATRRRHRQRIPNLWRCGAENRLTIDCQGKTYMCQVMADRDYPCFPDATIPVMCANCHHVNYCRGICPMIPNYLRKKLCMAHHLYYDALESLDKEGLENAPF